jgi:hypothetical protein
MSRELRISVREDTRGEIGRREESQERERQKGGRESGICRGRRRDGWIGGGRVGMSKGISPNEDKSKEKSDQDRWGGWI